MWFGVLYHSSVKLLSMVRPTPVCRRQADPLMVQKLWTAINFIRSQRQVANTDRIERYMQREYSVKQDETERQLNFAVADGLISVYRAVSNKGNNPGAEQDGYRIQPADENEVFDLQWCLSISNVKWAAYWMYAIQIQIRTLKPKVENSNFV